VDRRSTCSNAVALNLTYGEFNLFGAWPEDTDEQPLAGSLTGTMSRITPANPDYVFIARAMLHAILRKGWVERISPCKVRITESGKALREQIRSTPHWQKTEPRREE